MSEDIGSKEEQRLSRALQGKLGSQQTNANKPRHSWAPVQTGKPQSHSTPVNYTGNGQEKHGSGVDTSSPYANVANVVVSDEKLKQEQQRLKKWGLSTDVPTNDTTTSDNIPVYESPSSLNSSTASLSKSSASSFSEPPAQQFATTVKISSSTSTESLVDNTSILTNVDSHTNEEKMKQEQKRLERWGLKINTNTSSNTSPPSSTTSTPATNGGTTSPGNASVPTSPFTTSAAQVASAQHHLPVTTVQPFLDRVIFSAKAVKQVIQKKSNNHDATVAILLDLVKESASFGINLSVDHPMSFDISQNAGKLAGAVNELVKGQNENPLSVYHEILSLIGLLYLSVAAN
eukprot:gene8637-10631_t